MYAVIELKGHQYIVQKGDRLVVDKIDAEGGKVKVNAVLAVFDEEGKDVKLGSPYIEKAKVELSIVDHQQGEKTHVIKFKRKNRYSRKIGFRPQQTVLDVDNIIA